MTTPEILATQCTVSIDSALLSVAADSGSLPASLHRNTNSWRQQWWQQQQQQQAANSKSKDQGKCDGQHHKMYLKKVH
jgi:hypothetical protein